MDFSALMNMGGGGQRGPQPDAPMNDTAEKIQISSLSLLKMLKHGRAGVSVWRFEQALHSFDCLVPCSICMVECTPDRA